MKRSIKVAALALFATSLLGGCSSGGPAEQKITVDPSSLKVYVGESFKLESNVEKATWSLEDNEIGAQLSAVEGKSTMVSATMAGTVVAVAKADGYTTPKVTLTFELRNQQISVLPASLEAFVDDTFTLTSNAAGVRWSLEPNEIGAALSAETGATVSVSAQSAGTVVAVANADGYAESKVTLKFNELLPQTISSNPESREAFVGRAIEVSTDLESAGWALTENTAGAVLDKSSGKSVVVSASQVGEVVITATALNHEPASMRLKFVAPHWTDEEKAEMRGLLHGEVLPYAEGAGILDFQVLQGTIVRFDGSEISPEDLAAYAALFPASEGWVAQESSEEPSLYEFSFEKCIETEEGNRYVYVNFGSFNESYAGVANGKFTLIAYDPYLYEFPSANFELAKIDLEIESEVEVPAMPADHYYFNESHAAALCYGFAEGVNPEEAYSEILKGNEDFKVYGYDAALEAYVAEEKSGAFSLMYFSLDDGGLGIQLQKGSMYQSEWPTELVGMFCAMVLGSESVVPAFDAPRFFADVSTTGAALFVIAYDFESEEPVQDYIAIIEEAGWTYFGEFTDSKTGQKFCLADSPDGKVGLQFYGAKGEPFQIVISENYFEHTFPSEAIAADLVKMGIETEVTVPAIAAGGYDYENGRLDCYKLVSDKEDGGYSAILEAAGWSVFRLVDEDDPTFVYFVADSPDRQFSVQYAYNAEYERLIIILDEDTYCYYSEEWPELYASYVVAMFDSEVTLPDPAVEATSYTLIPNYYPTIICEGFKSELPDAGYTSKLQEEGYNILGVMGEGEDAYYAANSADSMFGLAYWYEEGNLFIQFTDPFPIELDEFPQDEIVASFAELGVAEMNLPTFTIASEEGYFKLDTAALAEGAYVLYAYGATSSEYSAYVAALEDAGWVIVEDEEEGRDYPSNLVLQYGETYAFVQIMDFAEERGFVGMAFYYEEPVITEFPEEQVLAFLGTQGFEGKVPFAPYTIADEEGEFKLQESNGYLYIFAYGSTEEEQAAYIEALEELGWTISKPGTATWPYDVTMTYGDTGVYLDLSDYTNYGGYIRIRVWFEAQGWPTAQIAAALKNAGFTDTLPEFSGEFSKVSVYTSQVVILVEGGAEADAVEQYQADLLAADYVELGPDSYGDMHYLSPSGEMDVCVWNGADYGKAGKVYIDFKEYVAPSTEFPLDEINAFLSDNSMGFQLTEALVDPSGEGYTIENGSDSWGYPNISVTVSGDAFDEDVALLADMLTAAGFEFDEDYSKEGYYVYYNNSTYSYVTIEYSEASNQTIVLFQA